MAINSISSGGVVIPVRGDLGPPGALAPAVVPALPPVAPIAPGAPALSDSPGFRGPGADIAADLAADLATDVALLAEAGDYLPGDTFSALAGAGRERGAAQAPLSMQDNQLFFSRQLVWQAPDAATLAASWRVMLKTYGEQRAAVMDMHPGQHLPSSLFMAEENPAALRDAPRAALQPEAEAWRFAVYGWGGQKMVLRLLAGDDDEAPPPQGKRRRSKVALRMELLLPESGRVTIQMEPLGEAVLLDLASSHAGALQLLRALLPELAELVARAGLSIARCRIGNDLPAIRVDESYSMRQAAATLSLGLFQAMADIALRLSRPPAQAVQQG